MKSSGSTAWRNTRVVVHLDHGRDIDDHVAVSNPAVSPYGYGYCAKYFALSMSKSVKESEPFRFFRRGLAYILGFDFVHAYRNRNLLSTADVIITHTEHEHLAVAALKKLGMVGASKLIAQSVWLWDEWDHISAARRRLYRWLLDEATLHTVLSPANAVVGSSRLRQPVYLIPFGANLDAIGQATRNPPSGEPILAIAPGSDRHRDWTTLVDATAASPWLRTTLVSRRLQARRAAARCRKQVAVVQARNSADMREMILDSHVVVVPLKSNLHASGVTVMIEGLLARRPVVMTDVGGVRFYGEGLVTWVSPGEAHALASGIHQAVSHHSDPGTLERRFHAVTQRGLTSKDYGFRHVFAVWMCLGITVDVELLSALTPVEPLVDQAAQSLGRSQ